jgi:hypothetical protein
MDQQGVPLHRYERCPTNSPTPEETPLAKQADVGKMLKDMQQHGAIEESESP